jgi:hypothetical protein
MVIKSEVLADLFPAGVGIAEDCLLLTDLFAEALPVFLGVSSSFLGLYFKILLAFFLVDPGDADLPLAGAFFPFVTPLTLAGGASLFLRASAPFS